MSHLSPFRLSAPNLNSELSTTSSNPKKRRKNTQNAIQSQTTMQDLLPPPLSGYGDTIVASNPFDDCPSTMSSVSMVRNPSNMGLGPPVPGPGPGPGPNGMGGGGMPHMNMCRPMGAMSSPLGMGSPMMHSPNGMQNNHGHGGHGHGHGHLLSQPMMMNGPRMNPGPPPPGSMGGHMGGHMSHNHNGPPMLNSPNVNMNVNGPMGSPMHVNPMNSPLGPNMNGAPMNSGPNMSNPMGPGVGVMSVNGLNGPGCPGPPPPPPHVSVSQQMNGPMGNPMAINSVAGGPMGPHGPPMNNNFMMGPMGALYPKPMPVSAGKVYPADQPMVFNSQNPNAPPIYPCGVCHKEVHDNDQAILCESGCNFWFHRGCTGLTEAAFQLLTAEVYAEWVCDKCLNTKNIPVVKFKP